jgi:hypothetical protein
MVGRAFLGIYLLLIIYLSDVLRPMYTVGEKKQWQCGGNSPGFGVRNPDFNPDSVSYLQCDPVKSLIEILWGIDIVAFVDSLNEFESAALNVK